MYKFVSSKNEKIITKLDSPSSILVVSIIVGALGLGLHVMSFFLSLLSWQTLNPRNSILNNT